MGRVCCPVVGRQSSPLRQCRELGVCHRQHHLAPADWGDSRAGGPGRGMAERGRQTAERRVVAYPPACMGGPAPVSRVPKLIESCRRHWQWWLPAPSSAADDVAIRGPGGHWGVGVDGVEDGDGHVPAAVGCRSTHVPDGLQVRPRRPPWHGTTVQTVERGRHEGCPVVSAPAFAVGGSWRWEGQAREGKVGGGGGTFHLSTKPCTQAGSLLVSTSDCTSCTSCTSRTATGTCASHTVPCRSLLGPPCQSTGVGIAYLSERLRYLEPYTYMSMI